MTDTRELILQRLLQIAGDTAGVVYAQRNDNDPGQKLPAVLVLEGDEQMSPATDESRRRPAGVMIPMQMIPQLMIVGGDKPADLGTQLNAIRRRLIDAVSFDTTLIALAGKPGGVAYRGLVSDLGLGRTMHGRMSLQFAINYMLVPEQQP